MLAEDSRPPYLLYGANGYTGRLIVAEADRRGIPLIVAGRRKDEIYRLAEQAEEKGYHSVWVGDASQRNRALNRSRC